MRTSHPQHTPPERRMHAAPHFKTLRHTTVGLGTKTLATHTGLSRMACWSKCVNTAGCRAAAHRAKASTCELLDSDAEHRLITTPRKDRVVLLYSANRREMTLPPLGWNDTRTRPAMIACMLLAACELYLRGGFVICTKAWRLCVAGSGDLGDDGPCPLLFGAPPGVYDVPMTAESPKAGRKVQCGGDAAWVAANPPSPATTCLGFLHCKFFNASVSVCERTREIFTPLADPCKRVGAGKQCGGDVKWVAKAEKAGGICCQDGLDCVWESPTLSKCVKIPAIQPKDSPFGDMGVRPRAAGKNKKCGGSVEGTALSDACIAGANLFCEYQKSFFAKCVETKTTPIDFTSDPPHACGGVGTQCMGSPEWVLGLGTDRTGVCCQPGLRCVFQKAFLGICDDPAKYIN
jgi:PAN domain